MSIYREEAIEALIEALCKKHFPNSQITALDALLSLSGRLTSSGEPYIEAWLLKIAGFDQPYIALMRAERPKTHEIALTGTMVWIYVVPYSCSISSISLYDLFCTNPLMYSVYRKKRRKLQVLGRKG